MHGVVPHTDTGQKDTMKVEFEDGHRYMNKELVRSGSIRDLRAVVNHHFSLGEQVCGVFRLWREEDGVRRGRGG